METLHGCLGPSLLQGISDLLFELAPVIEGFDPEEVNQGEKLLNLVLTAFEISNVGTPNSIQDLHWGAGKAPAVVTFELETSLRALGRPIFDRVCFV